MTKHEQIIAHISGLAVGSKISVRQIAKDLNVSEGTAYRAIKEAENNGIVSTIERVGTVRIEKKTRNSIDRLTFAEIVNIIDGQVLGGRSGLHKTLTKFAIGAMEIEDVSKYIGENTLLIVGNRVEVQKLALSKGSAVLLTGGFDTTEEVKNLSDQLGLPIISSNFDTFAVANMINRAIYDQLIKKEVLTAQDILIKLDETSYLKETDSIHDWHALSESSKHTRFPVLDANNKLSGMVTSKDIFNQNPSEKIKKVMTKSPVTVNLNTTVASCAHIMIWESIELLPVVSRYNNLIGIVSREDVLKAMQSADRQPHMGDTFNDQVLKKMKFNNDQISVQITPQMSNQYGSLSKSVFLAIIEESVKFHMKRSIRGDVLIDSINIFFIRTVQIDSVLDVEVKLLDMGRKFAKMEISILQNNIAVAKAMTILQVIEHYY
ncbi:DRTGG domain-containing protein [Macrococcus sp. EM39E]|uniref:DRTGG domain-containing protein n=1 Tax=Macrococcus animalis TaxID=3395467 RepID=UPI0039BF2B90